MSILMELLSFYKFILPELINMLLEKSYYSVQEYAMDIMNPWISVVKFGQINEFILYIFRYNKDFDLVW